MNACRPTVISGRLEDEFFAATTPLAARHTSLLDSSPYLRREVVEILRSV